MKTWYAMRERVRPSNDWRSKIDNTTSHAPTILFTPVYDTDLGDPLGSVDAWMSKEDLHEWLRLRLVLLGHSDDYVLVPPVGWYRDPDYI